MIKAAIFDMDGLLVDSEPLWRIAQNEVFAGIGVQATQADFHHNIGRRVNEVIEWYHRKYQWEGATVEEVVDAIVDRLIELVRERGTSLPGVHEAIAACKTAGWDTAIASSSPSRIIDAVVETLDLRPHFAHIYSAEHEPFGKPHPSVFITAAGLLGVHPEHCIVFEDSPSGVLAAKAAKMTCVAVPEPELRDNKFVQTADLILDSLADFRAGAFA